MPKPVGICTDQQQNHVSEIGKALGVTLPVCANVSLTRDDGILVQRTNDLGSTWTLEINSKGEKILSVSCSERETGFNTHPLAAYTMESFVPPCTNLYHLKFNNPISSDRLVRAQALIGKKSS